MRANRRLRSVLVSMLGLALVAATVTAGGAPATALTSGGWTTSASASPTSVAGGGQTAVTATVSTVSSQRALVTIEVHSPTRGRLHQETWDSQRFTANKARQFTSTWTVPSASAAEQLIVKVGTYAPRRTALYHWNDAAASINVVGAPTTTAPTTTAPTTTTPAPTTTTTTTTPPSGGTFTSGGWTTGGAASPSGVAAGSATNLTVDVSSVAGGNAVVDLEVYSPSGARVHQKVWEAEAFSPGVARRFTTTWTVPAGSAAERLTVKVGVFATGWTSMYHWNDAAATVTVLAATTGTTTTTAPTTTTTAPTTTTTAPTQPSGALPPAPAGWPSTLQLGMDDGPGGAAALKASVPVGFRYKYLAGGVNTGNGWASWNPNGDFARYYIEESRAAGIIPVFTYYMLYQSNPGVSMGEAAGVAANLDSNSTMASYYADLKLFFQRAGAAGGTTVLHVEPDMWAYLQQRATNNDATTVPVRVASTGMAELAGLPDNAAGLGQAIVRLRDQFAPNVRLGYHFSTWGSGNDFIYSDPSDSLVAGLGDSSARFYRTMNARFDVAFTDLTDRDAEFKRAHYGDNGASWYNADDYRRSTVFISAFVRASGLRAVIWQLPYGNTKMQAVNNTWDHYQDNKVEWLLDEPARTHLDAYADAGVLALMFGRGAGGVTCACDASGDGVTNPPAINGNTRPSLSADDDGGFFRDRAREYYRSGATALR